ncbi:hypothetical protein NQ318_005801 [Aromia moschata]|uniref:Fatty acyl-CoA reductase n=1 Tax=Aromia moschata TaxID=1265417 RepID=A0AAV8YTK4_9CUCU|nr:hypothetical protein NQ318_005801 [Aromia moschata]
MAKSTIGQWYGGQNIFVTGATGFMGKILVEKILRCCPDVGTVYLLIRPKKGKDPRRRLEDYLNGPVFDKIREQPDGEGVFQKLQCIQGDVSQANCCLSDQDQALLEDTVDVVFHMAANVRFDQPLKKAVLSNTGGTMNLLDLACRFRKLKVLVHVSTSYCHCEETEVQEKLYKAPHNPRKILDLASWMEDDILRSVTPKLLRNSPNTYAYTKCLTEQLVSEYSHKLPVVIARPSIVTAACKEPIPGWVDNLNGPTGILIGAGKGVIRTMLCNIDYTADFVPVDISINSLLIVAWKVGSQPRTNETEVFHITANREQPVSWGQALELGKKHIYKYPFSVCLWYPGGSPKSNYIAHNIAVFFFHLIPAYFVDFLMTVTRNKPFLVRTQRRIQNGLGVLQYYTTRLWFFHNEKLARIYDSLSETDRQIFYTNKEKLDMDEYMLNYILGARKYCAREDPRTLPHARRTLKKTLYTVFYAVSMEKSSLAEWYADQKILITGATGLMGKVLVEKLLRSCPKVATVYILIRPKKGKTAKDRLVDFLATPVFDTIRGEPNAEGVFKKISCINGDISEKNCDLSDDDKKLLSDTVTLIFHTAADVRFNQSLRQAVLTNIGGTLNVLELAKGFKKLKAFVHVSTLYCHCGEKLVEERLYKSPHGPRQLMDLVSWMDDDLLRLLTPKFLKDCPNTYAYTKCLSEELVSQYADFFPVVIARPSTVTAAYREPMPGWIDNLNGPTGIIVSVGKGLLRSVPCDHTLKANLVPVDVSINGLLVIAWKVGRVGRRGDVEVYHIMMSENQTRDWEETMRLLKKYYYKYPYSFIMWYPVTCVTSNRFLHGILVFFLHWCPAYVIDALLKLTGNKPCLVDIQKRINDGLKVFGYYTNRPWNFENGKLKEIHDNLTEHDKKTFYINSEEYDYDGYLRDYILGVRQYCVKEDLGTLPQARKMLKRFVEEELLNKFAPEVMAITDILYFKYLLLILVLVFLH